MSVDRSALHNLVTIDSSRTQTRVLPAVPGPCTPLCFYLHLCGFLHSCDSDTPELQLFSEAYPALQTRMGAPHPRLWHSATEGVLAISSDTGLIVFRYFYLSGGNMVSIKSFPVEEISDLHSLSHLSTAVVFNREANVPRDIYNIWRHFWLL